MTGAVNGAEPDVREVYRLARVGYEAYRAAVVPECQGATWEALNISESLQWMAAVEAVLDAVLSGAALAPTPLSSTALISDGAGRTEVQRTPAAQTPNPCTAVAKQAVCLAFFASVIKSGEPWTDACQRMYDEAKAAVAQQGAAQ